MIFAQTMTLDKLTKNTVVYNAPKGSHIPVLYIQKDAFTAGQFPAAIKITVELEAAHASNEVR